MWLSARSASWLPQRNHNPGSWALFTKSFAFSQDAADDDARCTREKWRQRTCCPLGLCFSRRSWLLRLLRFCPYSSSHARFIPAPLRCVHLNSLFVSYFLLFRFCHFFPSPVLLRSPLSLFTEDGNITIISFRINPTPSLLQSKCSSHYLPIMIPLSQRMKQPELPNSLKISPWISFAKISKHTQSS